jgi:ABC-type enterochelin transport system substrate-binding protein
MAVFENKGMELSTKPLQTMKTATKTAKHSKGSTKILQTPKTAKVAKLRVLGAMAVFVYRLSMLMITR